MLRSSSSKKWSSDSKLSLSGSEACDDFTTPGVQELMYYSLHLHLQFLKILNPYFHLAVRIGSSEPYVLITWRCNFFVPVKNLASFPSLPFEAVHQHTASPHRAPEQWQPGTVATTWPSCILQSGQQLFSILVMTGLLFDSSSFSICFSFLPLASLYCCLCFYSLFSVSCLWAEQRLFLKAFPSR